MSVSAFKKKRGAFFLKAYAVESYGDGQKKNGDLVRPKR